MSSSEGTDLAPSGDHTSREPERHAGDDTSTRSARPVLTPLAGFYTGTVLVVVVLGGLGLVLKALFDVDLSEHPGPFLVAILSLFVINVVLLVTPGSRRFARYMLFGLLATPVVVGGAAALTLFVLVSNDG